MISYLVIGHLLFGCSSEAVLDGGCFAARLIGMFSLPEVIRITTPHTFPQLTHTRPPGSQPLHSFYARPTEMHNLKK